MIMGQIRNYYTTSTFSIYSKKRYFNVLGNSKGNYFNVNSTFEQVFTGWKWKRHKNTLNQQNNSYVHEKFVQSCYYKIWTRDLNLISFWSSCVSLSLDSAYCFGFIIDFNFLGNCKSCYLKFIEYIPINKIWTTKYTNYIISFFLSYSGAKTYKCLDLLSLLAWC